MPIEKFKQKQLVKVTKRGWRSFDAQFLARASDVFDGALGMARTLVWVRDNLAVGDSLATPKSFSDSSRSLSDVIRGLCLDEVL